MSATLFIFSETPTNGDYQSRPQSQVYFICEICQQTYSNRQVLARHWKLCNQAEKQKNEKEWKNPEDIPADVASCDTISQSNNDSSSTAIDVPKVPSSSEFNVDNAPDTTQPSLPFTFDNKSSAEELVADSAGHSIFNIPKEDGLIGMEVDEDPCLSDWDDADIVLRPSTELPSAATTETSEQAETAAKEGEGKTSKRVKKTKNKKGGQ